MSADNDPSVVYSRTRKLVNCIEFQLQQLEEQEASQSSAARPGSSTGVLANGAGALADDDSMRRHAITENLNRLSAEVSLLERVVGEAYGGVAAASAKSDLWKKRLQQMQAEATSLRATVMRYLQASYLQAKAREMRDTRHRLLENASVSPLLSGLQQALIPAARLAGLFIVLFF